MRTYSDEAEALEVMRLRNRAYKRAGNFRDVCVAVDGPDDGETTLMDISEAINGDFLYRVEY